MLRTQVSKSKMHIVKSLEETKAWRVTGMRIIICEIVHHITCRMMGTAHGGKRISESF